MVFHARRMALIVCVAFGGCVETQESDVIGPRTTAFKSGATFAVCSIAAAPGTSTVDRADPVTGELLHLTQPPIVQLSDVKDVSIMEAPGQWPIVTVTFDPLTAERISKDARNAGGAVAVLINDEVLFTADIDDKPVSKLFLTSVIGGPDVRQCVK